MIKMFKNRETKEERKLKEVADDIQPIMHYLELFSSPLAPRGDGAKYEASKEFLGECIKLEIKILTNDNTIDYVSALMTIISMIGLSYIDYEDKCEELLNNVFENLDLECVDNDN